MKRAQRQATYAKSGFALVVTLSLMILLTFVAVGLLSLSAVSLRSSSQRMAQATAQANARLALMIAIGEVQKEMGPDMRVSASASIYDKNPNTEQIDGIEQPRWLASYDSWGNWLNASYAPSGRPAGPILNTYTAKRSTMFRRWLLSMPAELETNANAVDSISSWNNNNSVVLVGKGSLGTLPAERASDETRARLIKIGDKGAYAWWVNGENQKAKVGLAYRPRTLSAAKWENSQSDTAEVAVGRLDGFDAINNDETISKRLISHSTLSASNVDARKVKSHFFDLTALSRGVLASVRSGHLKKDLSLLLELQPNSLPILHRFIANSSQPEPSIRPMSPDLSELTPAISARHFQSWTNLRHFHRMYRQESNATVRRGVGTPDTLQWDGKKPYSGVQFPISLQDSGYSWTGENAYLRHPILAKLTYIYSLLAKSTNPGDITNTRYKHSLVYTPVFTYWNPYNTELRIPNKAFGGLSATYQVFPMRFRMYQNKRCVITAEDAVVGSKNLVTEGVKSFLSSNDGGDVVFAPGEFRVFTYDKIEVKAGVQDLVPGFNPAAYGGDEIDLGEYDKADKPGLALFFGHSVWGGNINFGNTPGSLNLANIWQPGSNEIQWIPLMYQHDWFNLDQTYTPVAPDPNPPLNPRVTFIANGTPAQYPERVLEWAYDERPLPVAYTQLVIKGVSEFDHESISWKKDWRCRNWLHAPPSYFGSATFISETDTIAHTQRLDSPYVMNFGATSAAELGKLVFSSGRRSFLGSGENPVEVVSAVPAIELPTAPAGSIASYSTMRINPGWANPTSMNGALKITQSHPGVLDKASLYFAYAKTLAYQSGVTGPGIGNSFIHPMIPRTGVYKKFENSISMDPSDRNLPFNIPNNGRGNNHMVFSDFWDHAYLLNDALWDDYFVSSLSDQTRPSESTADSLSANIDRLVADQAISNSRYKFQSSGKTPSEVKSELQAADGYTKASRYLMVDGMFNVNSTSVAAWFSLFSGIRERSVVYRGSDGVLRPVSIPTGKRIAISRFGTETSDKETQDPKFGVEYPDPNGSLYGWSGVRFLDDDQLRKLAEECVKQVKQRGPFLNFAEFINRRLSNDDLGLRGALQAAIDYDDNSPDAKSINGRYKTDPQYLMRASDLGVHSFETPEAVNGSRFAGIPGYVIQSDLLRPIANTMSVRDDTFLIRAYGDARDLEGNIVARAWCEATIQRHPEYADESNEPLVSARRMANNGVFSDNTALTALNRKFGRKFKVVSLRWLNSSEI
jgi:hypothetical protein